MKETNILNQNWQKKWKMIFWHQYHLFMWQVTISYYLRGDKIHFKNFFLNLIEDGHVSSSTDILYSEWRLFGSITQGDDEKLKKFFKKFIVFERQKKVAYRPYQNLPQTKGLLVKLVIIIIIFIWHYLLQSFTSVTPLQCPSGAQWWVRNAPAFQ